MSNYSHIPHLYFLFISLHYSHIQFSFVGYQITCLVFFLFLFLGEVHLEAFCIFFASISDFGLLVAFSMTWYRKNRAASRRR